MIVDCNLVQNYNFSLCIVYLYVVYCFLGDFILKIKEIIY